jgi:hypothetical protein
MKPSEKVALIKRISKTLAADDWTDIDLTLRQFGLPSSTSWDSSDKYGYCVRHIEDADGSSLITLGNHLFGNSGDDSISLGQELPWQVNRFRLFLGHISGEKKFVSAMKKHLADRGIDGFVAHEDIQPTRKWLDQIELALETCDALAAILTPGFHESKWTDQEVGFCVNRRVLVVPVRLGVDPYGFISRYQGFTPPSKDATIVARGSFDILCKHDLTAEKMGVALVSHFAESGSFADAKTNVKLLEHVKSWTPEMLREIEQAVEKNRQIRESFNVPDMVRAMVKEHGR